MDLLSWFQWVEAWPLSNAMREVAVFSALNNIFHLLSLVVFIGAVLIVDLRLLGVALTQQPVAQLARDAKRWLAIGFVGLLISGIPQIMQTATKEYYSPFFWMKMKFLLVAILFSIFVQQRVALADEKRVGPIWGKLVGLTSISLWAAVLIYARLIGLLS